MSPADLIFMMGRPVAYYPGLVKHFGSVNAVLMFCQFFYWHDKASSELGVYKSAEEIEKETGLSYREQVTARKQLAKVGILKETHKRLEHRIYYKIDLDKLNSLLLSGNCANRNSRTAESAFGDESEPQFVHTEITTEITSGSAQSAGAKVADIFEGSQYRAMTLGWKPDAATLKTYAAMQGVQLDAFSDDLIAGFVCHWAAHAEVCDTAAGWCNRLVKWVKSEKVRAAAQPPKPAADEAGVPVDQIIDLYHRACPNLPAVTVATDKALRSMIVERWNESQAHQSGKDFWLPFFRKANNRAQVFYRGQNVIPRLEALVSRAVFREISEAQA